MDTLLPTEPPADTTFAHGPSVDAVVFWGASGQAKVLRELLGQDGPPLIALFDSDRSLSSPWADIPLYHGRDGFDSWRAQQSDVSRIGFLIAIGGNKGGHRVLMQRDFVTMGLRPLVARHRTAFVADSARVGLGSQILAHAVVGVEAVLGEACIVNTSATVDHECRLGDGVHICPGAHLAGLVVVEDNVMIGTGAVVLPRVRIGSGALVGAGTVVTQDVPAGACIVGNPGRPIVRKSG